MENASQALIIAAGVLIGIVIISMGVYLFSQAAAIPKNYSEKLENDKLAAFNEKFEVYSRQDSSAQDIVTVINLAIENNRKYDETDIDYYIKIYLDGTEMTQTSINVLQETEIGILQDTKIEEVDSQKQISYPYKCEEIKYSEVTGRVISLKFKKE